ncbi:MAG: hypothetical protein ABRQ25_04865 [Clostridiaceae bacterium]
MQKVNIAGLTIEIINNKLLTLDRFKPFLYFGEETPDIIMDVRGCQCIHPPQGKIVLDEKIKWVKGSDEEGDSSVYICKEEPDEIAYLLNTNNEWNKASIMYKENDFNAECAATGPLGEILFRNGLLFNRGLVLHASAVQYEGKGIVFSAPSETGKTTQASLWCENMGATLINNDRPAIKIIGDKPYVYGTPWSGLPSECNNNYAPLTAIVMLEQSYENSIYKLNTQEAILRLMPRCFLPYYDKSLMNIAINNLEDLLKGTPIYLLKCRPDKEAVELVYKTIWRNNI